MWGKMQEMWQKNTGTCWENKNLKEIDLK